MMFPGNIQCAPTEWAIRDRIGWVTRFRRLLAANADSLSQLMEEEIGKPFYEGLTAEIAPLIVACKWHERHAVRILRPRRLSGGSLWQFGQRHWENHSPIGHIGIIATWNYPIQLLGVELVQALLAGNSVIVKPSENSPCVQHRLLDLAHEAGLPPGILRRVEPTREAGARLLREEHLDHVVFTGSTLVGCAIAEWAASSLTPTTLELSGRDSAFVLADADPALAARTIWNGVTMNAGQTCMAPRRALVHADVYPAFVREIMPLAAAARPLRLISERAARASFDLAQRAVTDGGRSASAILEPPQGRDLRPIAILDCPADTPLVDGDHFGPALAVVPVNSFKESLAIHERCTQHLATSIFTRDINAARALAPVFRAGKVTINDCIIPTAHPNAPLTGTGDSGWGVTRGREGLLAMTRTINVSSTHSRIRPPISEPSPKLVATMSRLIRRLYANGQSPSPRTPDAPTPTLSSHHTNHPQPHAISP